MRCLRGQQGLGIKAPQGHGVVALRRLGFNNDVFGLDLDDECFVLGLGF